MTPIAMVVEFPILQVVELRLRGGEKEDSSSYSPYRRGS
jgi:hypothetical protein